MVKYQRKNMKNINMKIFQEVIDSLCADIPYLNELLNLDEILNDVLKTLLNNGIKSINTVSPPIIKVL